MGFLQAQVSPAASTIPEEGITGTPPHAEGTGVQSSTEKFGASALLPIKVATGAG